MSFSTELASWLYLPRLKTNAVPHIGDKAPSTEQLVLPCGDERPAIIVFLRHCGCPFAEKTFIAMRRAAEDNDDIHFIAVSHSDKPSTDAWIKAVGGTGKVGVIVDEERTLYAQWGLGVSDYWHIFSWEALWSVFKLAREENIKARPTQSGSRWQTAGFFVVDGQGIVRYGGASKLSSDIPNFQAAIESVR